MNQVGHGSANATICDGRDLPWLQESSDDDVWGDWSVTYRDVIILDHENRPVDVFNLTTYDLSEAANREELLRRLRAIAAGE